MDGLTTEIDLPVMTQLLRDAIPGICWSLDGVKDRTIFMNAVLPDGSFRFRCMKLTTYPMMQVLTEAASIRNKWIDGEQK